MSLVKRTSFLSLLLIIAGCAQTETFQLRNDFKKYYDRFDVQGSFVLYDDDQDRYIVYNHDQTQQPFIPASTFKICNSLIGLETGVINDENFMISWDSVMRRPAWNGDQDLQTAFKNSTVWYYQELARRVGEKQMKHWLDTAQYGNADTTGGVDSFWLSGGLRITPEQQVDFLRRLHAGDLPFSQRSMDIVKKIMIAQDTAGYVMRAKTGWSRQNEEDIGWYVGYLEVDNKAYFFANCIQTKNFQHQDFGNARKDIVDLILADLHLTAE